METIVEKNHIIDELKIKYRGYFDLDELLEELAKLLKERGYGSFEKEAHEKVTDTGRNVFMELKPKKQKNKFDSLMIQVRIYGSGIKEEVVKIQSRPRKLSIGELEIVFDAWVYGLREFAWRQFGFKVFAQNVFNKLLKKPDPLAAEVASDTNDVYARLRSFLNLYRYKIKQ